MEEEEGVQDFDEDEVVPTSSHNMPSSNARILPTSRSEDDGENTPPQPPQPPPNVHVPISSEDLSKMHIPDLKKELRARKLPVSGAKMCYCVD